MKRRKWSFGWLMLILLFVLLGVAVLQSIRLFRSRQEEGSNITYEKYYAMITDDPKSALWKSVYQGAYEEGLERGVYVELLGENLDVEYSKEQLMRIAIASGVDGILLDASETEEMATLIDEAMEKDIPVVTVYGDCTKSLRCCFVGVGSYNIGCEYGRKVLEIAGSNAMQQKEGPLKVSILVNSYAKDSGQNILCSGIQETIEAANSTDIEITLVAVDDTNAFAAEESIRDLFMNEDCPDVFICLNELNTTCVMQAVVDYIKVGQVHVLGYYDSTTILKSIDRGVVDATVSLDAGQMGAYSVKALEEYKEYGNTSQYVTVDVRLIDSTNLNEYLPYGTGGVE